ncbi:hypothetical protein HK097_005613 [Rhizophlyctis rosea]|uniref:Uncharacterized protein n=1 Tax=Rhizophlyctis rosea TaxID=64517 RepID=A0AAD5SGM1_9FUNG|nr:hypothetical protein HK097_005613 [Rhizophlyctis rosea]
MKSIIAFAVATLLAENVAAGPAAAFAVAGAGYSAIDSPAGLFKRQTGTCNGRPISGCQRQDGSNVFPYKLCPSSGCYCCTADGQFTRNCGCCPKPAQVCAGALKSCYLPSKHQCTPNGGLCKVGTEIVRDDRYGLDSVYAYNCQTTEWIETAVNPIDGWNLEGPRTTTTRPPVTTTTTTRPPITTTTTTRPPVTTTTTTEAPVINPTTQAPVTTEPTTQPTEEPTEPTEPTAEPTYVKPGKCHPKAAY